MDPESSPDPDFRASVEAAIAEDRPAILVALLGEQYRGRDQMEIALTDGTDPMVAADILDYAAARLRDGLL